MTDSATSGPRCSGHQVGTERADVGEDAGGETRFVAVGEGDAVDVLGDGFGVLDFLEELLDSFVERSHLVFESVVLCSQWCQFAFEAGNLESLRS